MSLLDVAKEKANKYISPKDFLCFLAYKLDEPIENVVSFLIYHNFSDLVDEYYIDEHYRIYSVIEMGYKFKTERLFDEIAKDGFFDYMMFCHEHYDDCSDGNDTNSEFYELVEMDFYYSLDELNQLGFIKKLNLNLDEGKALDYTVTGDDIVTAQKSENNLKKFKLIPTNDMSDAEIAKWEQEVIDKHGKGSVAYKLHRVIAMASKGEFDTQQQIAFKNDEQIISELKDQVTQLTNDNANLENQLAQIKAEQADALADDKELSGIAKYNANKAYIIATSQALASYIWSMDTEKAIRTGDMVQQVRHVMHSVAPKLLPDNDAIRQWLSSIAPDYAKKGGKTPKDAPSEISLIMKK